MNERSLHARKLLLVASGILLTLCRPAHCQTNAEVNAGIQFNFSSPGARSLGLGGAFIGLADDATAAYTNPAGLTQLSKPEVSAEGRRSSYTNQFTDSGHGLGSPTGNGLDKVPGIVSGTSKSELNDLSFASFVYPHGRWALAAYRQELANFGASFQTQGAFFSSGLDLSRLFPIDTTLRLRIINVGVSGAVRLNDALSIGVGLSEYHFDLSSLTSRYAFESLAPNPDGTFPRGGFFGQPDVRAGNVVNFESLNGNDNHLAVNAGLLWKISSQWSGGLVYRQGPKFNFDTSATYGPMGKTPGMEFAANPGSFHVPDAYGAGLAFRPAEAWTITVDYDRIRYSVLAKNSIDVFFDHMPMSKPDPAAKSLVANDANEFHLGVEYVWTHMKWPLALRLGGWRDPDHQIRFEGPIIPNTVMPNQSEALYTLFRPGRVEGHVSGGFGLVFSERFQLDAAYDYSKFVSIASLSGVVRF